MACLTGCALSFLQNNGSYSRFAQILYATPSSANLSGKDITAPCTKSFLWFAPALQTPAGTYCTQGCLHCFVPAQALPAVSLHKSSDTLLLNKRSMCERPALQALEVCSAMP